MPPVKKAQKGSTSKGKSRSATPLLEVNNSRGPSTRSNSFTEVLRTFTEAGAVVGAVNEENEEREELAGSGEGGQVHGEAGGEGGASFGRRVEQGRRADFQNGQTRPVSADPSTRSRLQPLTAASSSSEISYADAPVNAEAAPTRFALEGRAKRASDEAARRAAGGKGDVSSRQEPNGSRNAFNRAPSPFFAHLPAAPAPSNQIIGLPPSAFSLPPHQSSSYALPGPPPAHKPLALSLTRTAENHFPSAIDKADEAPASNALLDSFLAADRAVKENQPVRTRSRVEEWRDEVAEVSAAEDEVGKGSVGRKGRWEEEEEEEEELEEDEGEALDEADDLIEPNKLSSAEPPRRAPSPPSHSSPQLSHSASPSFPISETSSLAPSRTANGRRKKSVKPSAASSALKSKPKKTSKITTKQKRRAGDDVDGASPCGSGSGGTNSRTYKTKDFLKLLPKRRKVVRVREDTDEEEEEESDAETDYDVVTSSRRRPSSFKPGRKKSAAASSSPFAPRKPVYGKASGKKKQTVTTGRGKGGKGKKRRSREEEEEDSESERRKEAAKAKWAAVDDYAMETVLTL